MYVYVPKLLRMKTWGLSVKSILEYHSLFLGTSPYFSLSVHFVVPPPQYQLLYRVGGQYLVDLGFVCFLTRYCFACSILLGMVDIRQNGQITLAAMVETTKSQSTKNSLRGDCPPFTLLENVLAVTCEFNFAYASWDTGFGGPGGQGKEKG